MRKIPMGSDVKEISWRAVRRVFSGADLATMVNEAALFAARGKQAVRRNG